MSHKHHNQQAAGTSPSASDNTETTAGMGPAAMSNPTPAPDAAQAQRDIDVIIGLEHGLSLQPPLKPRERAVYDRRIASVGVPMIQRAAQIAALHDGSLAHVDFDPEGTRATLAYAAEYGPVALQCIETGHRIQDDTRRRMEDAAQKTMLLHASLRKAAKKDPTLLPYLRDMDALKPKRRTRKAAAESPDSASSNDGSSPSASTSSSAGASPSPTASGGSHPQPATVVVVHGETASNGGVAPAVPPVAHDAGNGAGGGGASNGRSA